MKLSFLLGVFGVCAATTVVAAFAGASMWGVVAIWVLAVAGMTWARGHREQAPSAPAAIAPTSSSDEELKNLRAVLDGMADGVWITQNNGTVLQHNRAMKELLFTSRPLIGQRPIELLRNAPLHDAVERACQQQASSELDVTIEGVRPRSLAVSVIPLGSKERGSMAVFRDVTELRHLEKVRKDFVANVSHELRTPITAIRGYAETLGAGALTDAQNAPRMIEIIHRQSERLAELVEDLLELSRIESKEFSLKSESVGLAAAGNAAIETVRPKAQSKKLRIDATIPAGALVLGDARALDQVLVNLLDNAVKYTPDGGQVELKAVSVDGSRFEIQVRDTGTGMEPKHLDRIFERFYRVDKGRAREVGGTGLGLSIVKHLVTAMNGDVRVESTPGQGTAFFVVLPSPPAARTTSQGTRPGA
jgi:two-component system phosphate regulon sensor histidine kinase PhoR